MRIAPTVVFAASCLLARAGWSDDVSYKLDLNESNSTVTSASLDLPKIAIADRAWAAPGVEQSLQHLLPPRPFDFAKPYQRIRFEYAPTAIRDSFALPYAYSGPEWLDDAVWPLTRELYGAGRPDDFNERFWPRENVTLGDVTLNDREWTATGIEKDTTRSEPSTQCDKEDPASQPDEDAEEIFQVSYQSFWPAWRLVVDARAGWLADDTWPLTRQEFRVIDERRKAARLLAEESRFVI